ncbi:hypothetical protein ANN_06487 [Periplaneta americana]|uniref:Uncharacterized protein n=1 Tax=Periplaneta americana TaxID=6978 RepID=A0ABQ8TG68_PERAM|nr:hypothetical protein ANN_06487 [Periplaneta americana]
MPEHDVHTTGEFAQTPYCHHGSIGMHFKQVVIAPLHHSLVLHRRQSLIDPKVWQQDAECNSSMMGASLLLPHRKSSLAPAIPTAVDYWSLGPCHLVFQIARSNTLRLLPLGFMKDIVHQVKRCLAQLHTLHAHNTLHWRASLAAGGYAFYLSLLHDGTNYVALYPFQRALTTTALHSYTNKVTRLYSHCEKKLFIEKGTSSAGSWKKKLKERLVKCFVWSVTLCGTETWTLRRSEEKRLEAFEMRIWRRMERVKWTDKIRNEVVLERVGEERMMQKLIR